MGFMDEVGFVGHALCDYLRPLLPASDIDIITTDLLVGEPYSAISWALEAAVEDQIPLPPVYVQNILAVKPQVRAEVYGIEELITRLPQWALVA